MTPVEVVKALIGEGVEFATDGQRITWRNDDGWMKPEVIALLKSGRPEIIAYLVAIERDGVGNHRAGGGDELSPVTVDRRGEASAKKFGISSGFSGGAK